MSVVTGACFTGACHVCRYPEPPFETCDCPHHKEEDVAVIGEAEVRIIGDSTQFRKALADVADVYADHLEMMANSMMRTANEARQQAANIRAGLEVLQVEEEEPEKEDDPNMPHEYYPLDDDEDIGCGITGCGKSPTHPIHRVDDRR